MKFKLPMPLIFTLSLLIFVLINRPLPKPVLAILQPFKLLLGIYPENLLVPLSNRMQSQGGIQSKGHHSLGIEFLQFDLALRGQGERASAHTRRSRSPNVPVTR